MATSSGAAEPYGQAIQRTRSLLLGLLAVCLAGTADVAEFLATRTTMFRDAPSRAAGSVLGLALWLALLGVVTARYTGGDRRLVNTTIWLAGVVAAGNVGLAAIHLKAGIGGFRPMLGGVLGIAALVLALASRNRRLTR
jgi:hypothetical protein